MCQLIVCQLNKEVNIIFANRCSVKLSKKREIPYNFLLKKKPPLFLFES